MKTPQALAIVMALLTSACSSVDDSVSAAIGNAVREKHAQEIRIAALTDFEWEKVYLFGPYAPRAHICEVLGVEARQCERIVPFESMDDGVMSLAFVSGTQVVRYARHSRLNGDFTPVANRQPILASEAVFKVVPSGLAQDGRPWVKLVPKAI
ncbi:hypothetical protein SAMN02787076_01551 [Rhizobacter sp. OV335]|jgi:hypothetical protein|nr:hypothetical protein SAMN02787076_01551 [Rhizobacter sp. OV335]